MWKMWFCSMFIFTLFWQCLNMICNHGLHLNLLLVIFNLGGSGLRFVILGHSTQNRWLIEITVVYTKYFQLCNRSQGCNGSDNKKRGRSRVGMFEPGREQNKWTVICSVLIQLRMLSLLLTSFSLGGLIYCTALPSCLPAYSQTSFTLYHSVVMPIA